MSAKILVVDDEVPIRDMVRFALQTAGFEVMEADCVATALTAIQRSPPDLILLDWMLPDTSGIDLIQQLKVSHQFTAIPIIMLTAKADENNKVVGLEAGADDYVVKPFSPRELIARIQTVLRRIQDTKQDEKPLTSTLELGLVKLDLDAKQVWINHQKVKTGPIEYKLFEFFLSHPGKVFSRQFLLETVWKNIHVTERTVDVHIRHIRKLLAKQHCDHYIRTVRNSGYCFEVNH
ncbi:MAG: response regulator [Legionellales bacterium]|nr:response regulator [Legionellales bacterium]